MSVQNPERLATKQDLKDMYDRIRPYMGGLPEVVANKFSKGDIYSTDEKMIGQWIDGKPLYQIVVSDVIQRDTSLSLQVFCELGTDKVIQNVKGRVDTNIFSIPVTYAKDDIATRISIFMNTATTQAVKNGSISYFSSFPAACTTTTMTLVVQYTKTSDTAISIGETTDYSTEEKIIGTWLNGEPIYQKTITNFIMPSATNTKTSNFLGVSVDRIVKFYGSVIDENNYSFSFFSSFGNNVKFLYNVVTDELLIQYNDASWAYGKYADITIQYTKSE